MWRDIIKNKLLLLVVASLLFTVTNAQKNEVNRIEPPFWWVGMENNELQLLVYGPGVGEMEVNIDHQDVSLEKVHKADSKNYLFLDLKINQQSKPGFFSIDFKGPKNKKRSYQYELKAREDKPERGLTHADVVYLITPDRFVNGDETNDVVKGLKEGKNRSFYGGRHGGDLKGIISKLDYMEDLGVTALWLNPVLINDMPEFSYHGYAATDYYLVDPRYGTNEDYKMLSKQLQQKNMKLVMDQVFNHCGSEHWWMKDQPFNDWINNYPDIKITNHAMASISDPYATESDKTGMVNGWFVTQMPDLNHDNPFMANYLIQNSIWWIEYAGLDGIRQDTYPYNKREMMIEWAQRVKAEYPDFYIVGETWVDNEAQESWWSEKASDADGFNSKVAMTDFPLCNAIHRAFKKDGNIYELYRVLSRDFLYYKPENNKIFADNHDMDRIFYTLDGDLDKYKLAMTFLTTTRGKPQIYYGTEILMKGHQEHGVIREDFPGGWQGDARDAFTQDGRTDEENEAFDHLRKLLNWRKNNKTVIEGELKHYVPYENVYVYSRILDNETVLVILNNNASTVELDMTRFTEVTTGHNAAKDAISGKSFNDFKNIKKMELLPNQGLILEMEPKSVVTGSSQLR